jgi:ABC-2 type transport system permease protein/sodium transport system permease protein
MDLIVGKFLVVTTVAIAGATLNLASVTATVYFGGFDKVIASTGGRVPIEKMLFILLALIPFAVLMSAIMIAVCSYARTFKEAQNYVTPVILAVLIPGGIAALPATRLEGPMLVMPVGNMVLLAKEMLLGASVPPWHVMIVLASTTLYAGAAVAVAAKTFGHESVVFADAGSLKAMFSRAMIRPSRRPAISLSLLVTAMWFPLWFFVQSALSPEPGETAVRLLHGTAWLMPLIFVVLPILILAHWKVDLVETFAVRMPGMRPLVAAILIGVSAWVPAHELNVVQNTIIKVPESFLRNAAQLVEAIGLLPTWSVFLILAIVPACCEELLFRGFLLSGLASAVRKWPAIVISACFFAVFHFFFFKFVVAGALGVVLGYLCWQSRSIFPAVIAHALHNAIGVLTVLFPDWLHSLGIAPEATATAEWTHLPLPTVLAGSVIFAIGLLLSRGIPPRAASF